MERQTPLTPNRVARRRPSLGLFAAIVLAVAATSGCGGDGKTLVTGTVAFDGKPMPDGYVIFTPEDGGSPGAGPIADGKYSLRTVPGNHRIEIEASQFVGPKSTVMGLQAREQYVPARYNSETTLHREVKADGENVFDFELSSKP
jgi:hypothetical protein